MTFQKYLPQPYLMVLLLVVPSSSSASVMLMMRSSSVSAVMSVVVELSVAAPRGAVRVEVGRQGEEAQLGKQLKRTRVRVRVGSTILVSLVS